MLAKIPIEGNIVEEYLIGNTRVYISDAYFINNTPEDNQRVLDAAARASLNIILHNQADPTYVDSDDDFSEEPIVIMTKRK